MTGFMERKVAFRKGDSGFSLFFSLSAGRKRPMVQPWWVNMVIGRQVNWWVAGVDDRDWRGLTYIKKTTLLGLKNQLVVLSTRALHQVQL